MRVYGAETAGTYLDRIQGALGEQPVTVAEIASRSGVPLRSARNFIGRVAVTVGKRGYEKLWAKRG